MPRLEIPSTPNSLPSLGREPDPLPRPREIAHPPAIRSTDQQSPAYPLTIHWLGKRTKGRHMGTAPAVGAKAPPFTLPGDDGKTVSLADFAGRKLVLYFYPRADTPGCTREAI